MGVQRDRRWWPFVFVRQMFVSEAGQPPCHELSGRRLTCASAKRRHTSRASQKSPTRRT